MSLFDTFRQRLEAEIPIAVATVIAGPEGVGSKILVEQGGTTQGQFGSPELARRVAGDAIGLLREELPDTVSYELPEGTYEVFIDVFPAPRQLIIVGATDTAIALSSFAKLLGYRVIITDARGAFAVPERFPDADRVIKGWPQDVLPGLRMDEATFVVLLSHDPKFDEPTLQHVLPSSVPYIGAIGSRKTQRERFDRLRAEGFAEEQLARVYGPVGLDLGGRCVEETALAIIAEITAVRHGREGGMMSKKEGAVSHQPSTVSSVSAQADPNVSSTGAGGK